MLDNFFLVQNGNVDNLPGVDLWELGEHIRRFNDSIDPVSLDSTVSPVYLGGWPSANFWAMHGQLLLSSLLYSGQLLVRDPISDWFSFEQYNNRHRMGSRPGFLNADGSPNIVQTRAFLSRTLPMMEAWRPLIENGIVVLVPSEDFTRRKHAEIQIARDELAKRLLDDPADYSTRFSPDDIAVEDNTRGMFVFVGGEREKQIVDAVTSGLEYFAREYLLATHCGATYTAPFAHESHICRSGISAALRPSQRVVDAVLNSELPIFHGLTPEIISTIHADDSFASFRQELHSIYHATPTEGSQADVDAYIADQENALLMPSIRQAERSADAGAIGRIGVALAKSKFGIASAVVAGAIAQDPFAAAAAGAGGVVLDNLVRAGREAGAQRVWTALVRHQRGLRDEISNVTLTDAQPDRGGIGAETSWWGIREEPSREIIVSRGAMLLDSIPSPQRRVADPQGTYTEGIYRICECGSGRKFKFCCKGLAVRK